MENLTDYAGFDGFNNFKKVRVPITQQEWGVRLPNGDFETFNCKQDAEVFAALCLCTTNLPERRKIKLKRV